MKIRILCFAAALAASLCVAAGEEPVWKFPGAGKDWRGFDCAVTAGDTGVVLAPRGKKASLVLAGCDIDSEAYDTLFVAVRGSVTGVASLRTAATGDRDFSVEKARQGKIAGKEAAVALFRNSEAYRVVRFDLPDSPAWQGRIGMLRLDCEVVSFYTDRAPGDRFEIAWIALARRRGNRFDNGDGALQLGGAPVGWEFAGDSSYLAAERCFRAAGADSSLRVPFASLDRQGRFVFSFDAAGAAGSATLEFTDIDGKALASQKIAIPAGKSRHRVEAEVVAPELAAAATVVFRPDGAGELRIASVSALKLADGSILTDSPYPQKWRAKWIRPRGRDFRHGFLRREFTLPEGAIKGGEIQFSADDRATVWLNGKVLAESSGKWENSTHIAVDAGAFCTGKNVIEAELHNEIGLAGFLCELRIAVGGKVLELCTDAAWQGSSKRGDPAAEPCRVQPGWAWQKLAYQPMKLRPLLSLAIDKVPPTVTRGTRLRLPVRIGGLEPGGVTPGIASQFWQKGKLLSENWFQPTLRNGEIEVEFNVPRTLATGETQLRCQLIDADCTAYPVVTTQVVPNPDETKGFPTVKIVRRNGVSTLTIDGKEVSATQALVGEQEKELRNAADAGIHLWGTWVTDFGMTQAGTDFTKTDYYLNYYLGNDPDARLIINLIVDGRYHTWYLKDRPEARERLETGSDNLFNSPDDKLFDWNGEHLRYSPCYASPVWRKGFGDGLREFVRYLRKSPFANRIAGIQICCGSSSEWFHWGAAEGLLLGYSDAGKQAFRAWLKRRYGTVDALRKAWLRPDVTFETAEVPSGTRRRPPATRFFFDPGRERDVIDFNDFLQYICCDAVRHYARIVREESEGKILVGAYYGYVFHLSEGGVFGQYSGHFDSRQFLDAPELDFTVSPICYDSLRQIGNTGGTMLLPDSWNLAGKLAWNQADLRTQWCQTASCSTFRNQGNIETIDDAKQQMERELARNLAEGNSIQWYDFALGWTMGDRRLMQTAKKLRELADRYRGKVEEFPPEHYALVVVDENVVSVWNPETSLYAGALVNVQRWQFIRSGVPWKAVLFTDLMKHPELLRHRMIFFTNSVRLDEARIRFLKEKVLCGDRLAVFTGPVGLVSDRGFGGAAAEALFGGKVRLEKKTADLQAVCTGLFPAIAGERYGTYNHGKYGEFLVPEQVPGAQSFAKFAGSPGGDAAIYWRRGDCRILWSVVPSMSSAVLRELARRHGVPVVADGDDPVYVGHGCFGIHASADGVKTLRLPKRGAVRELFSGRTWSAGTAEVRLPMKRGETRIFVVE